MQFLKRNFLAGLPIMATIGILVWAFTTLDGFLAGPQKWLFKLIFGREFIIPGLGVLLILVGTLIIGLLIAAFVTKSMRRYLNSLLNGAPLVKMLYGALKDLFQSFASGNKSFDRPVLVRPFTGSSAGMLGFVTNQDLSGLGLQDQVAVYLPQSYNFAGNVIIVPKDAVTPLPLPSGDVMKFVLSGGISAAVQTPSSSDLPAAAPASA